MGAKVINHRFLRSTLSTHQATLLDPHLSQALQNEASLRARNTVKLVK